MEPLSAVCRALIELGPQVKIVNLLCALIWKDLPMLIFALCCGTTVLVNMDTWCCDNGKIGSLPLVCNYVLLWYFSNLHSGNWDHLWSYISLDQNICIVEYRHCCCIVSTLQSTDVPGESDGLAATAAI